MKKIALLILIALASISCKNSEKQQDKNSSNDTLENTKESHEIDLDKYIVFEEFLNSKKIEEADYVNVTFNEKGTRFNEDLDKESYIKIPFSNLDLKNGFNISFSYNTFSEVGSKPQALISLVDRYSSPTRVPFYIYLAARRITCVFGEQVLWAEGYDRINQESKEFFDSYPLDTNTFYFVSINVDKTTINIYVNSELYASFKNIKQNDLIFDNIMIGSTKEINNIVHPFYGYINGLKIYRNVISENQIIEMYNAQPYFY